MAATGEAASRVARRLGVEQVGDAPEIDGWVQVVLDAHPAEVARYRDGEDRLLGFFMGEAMKRSGGKADPSRLREALLGRLG